MNSKELFNAVRGAMIRIEVTLRSGQRSDHYYDIKSLFGNPKILRGFADEIYKKLTRYSPTHVVGLGHGGIPLATALSLRHDLSLCSLRNKEKEHGLAKIMEGAIPSSEDRVIIVDDVLTSGGSLKEATKIIAPTEAQIVAYGVVLDRRNSGSPWEMPAPVRALFTKKYPYGLRNNVYK